ncbi:MAG: hypothetical protein IPI43_24305 [Sandaracinaceae bacterium]|nr:hypothetical protein [Sandaracinaceae bacterium]
MDDATTWADEEFGGADLGDVRRTRRLVRVAARVAQAPGGTRRRLRPRRCAPRRC